MQKEIDFSHISEFAHNIQEDFINFIIETKKYDSLMWELYQQIRLNIPIFF